MLDRDDWIRHIAITCYYISHCEPIELVKDGLITVYDAKDVAAYIRDTLAPAGPGHAAVEHISVGRPRPSKGEVQLQLDFSH